ncbi:unnamed protein product [Adineta steineri]|uniref:Uncharacterized protein n=1 Tax=Adineta steineri TaxID=433720 RepID=A0A813VYG0_9BILA|nr:unnamed protein product [Adineta steineri]CAF1489535.1 unnamed protein product [Adineta steineri]
MPVVLTSARVLVDEPCCDEVQVTKYVRRVPIWSPLFFDSPIKVVSVDSRPIITRTKRVTIRKPVFKVII